MSEVANSLVELECWLAGLPPGDMWEFDMKQEIEPLMDAAAHIRTLETENAALEIGNEALCEGFQLAADVAGYQGDWHDSAPIRELISQNAALKEQLSKSDAYKMVDHCCCRFEEDGETQKQWCSIHAALRERVGELQSQRNDLLDLSRSISEHPEDYDGPCECNTCMTYAAEDGDGRSDKG